MHRHFRVAIALKLAGIFNVYNALLTAGVAMRPGHRRERTSAGDWKACVTCRGASNCWKPETPYRVILDYAHSPGQPGEHSRPPCAGTTKGRMIALFGCGGDRDHGKRPIMGEIAGRLADLCILTSDNPRNGGSFRDS